MLVKKTTIQLHEDLENARGGMNTGDIEAAVAAIAEREITVMRTALQLIIDDWEFVKTREGYGDRSERYAETAKNALAALQVER
jgi:hypothetical protein